MGFDSEALSKSRRTQIGRYSSRIELFRQLQRNFQFIRSNNPPRILALSSPMPNEGKIMSAPNLVSTHSQAGFKIAIVETDIDRPKVGHTLSNLK